jgi:hypothetical protein
MDQLSDPLMMEPVSGTAFRCRHVGLIASVVMMLLLQSCHIAPYVPDLDGTYVPHSATVQTDPHTEAAILNSFKQAENALKRKDLDSLMNFYADNYQHTGFTKDRLRTEWERLFQDYRDFSATHVLTRIVVDADRVPRTAQVTCTGSLWAIANDTNQRVNIDSWYNEIHYLAYVDGAWRIQGHAWEVVNPKDTRTARPPHPFF